jgi:hypothetical protein
MTGGRATNRVRQQGDEPKDDVAYALSFPAQGDEHRPQRQSQDQTLGALPEPPNAAWVMAMRIIGLSEIVYPPAPQYRVGALDQVEAQTEITPDWTESYRNRFRLRAGP